MLFTETRLEGAYLIDLERRLDERGFFARAFCQKEFLAQGLKPVIAQANVAFNLKRGTLRGMHFQRPPSPEPKLVRCTKGAIYDVIVDLRRDSPTWRRWLERSRRPILLAAQIQPGRSARRNRVRQNRCCDGYRHDPGPDSRAQRQAECVNPPPLRLGQKITSSVPFLWLELRAHSLLTWHLRPLPFSL